MNILIFILNFLPFCKSLDRPSIYYPYHPKIHNFGNVGFGGRIHALLARPATKLIDIVAYNGENIRNKIIGNLDIENPKIIADFACGVGISTEALLNRYSNASISGIDTSTEMLDIANLFAKKEINYILDNIEFLQLETKANLITIMFTMHEIPEESRKHVLLNAYENLEKNGSLLIVDIALDYKPSKIMLDGEPYVENYLKNIQNEIKNLFPNNHNQSVVLKNHVTKWLICKT